MNTAPITLEKVQHWDIETVKKIYFYAKTKSITEWARRISYFGDPRLWGLVGLILGIHGFIKADFAYLVLFITAFFQSYFIYYAIKQWIKRPRPFVLIPEIDRMDKTGHGHGFPSGHSHHSTLLVGMIWLVFFPSPWLIPLLILYNLTIAITRMMTGCHFPTDVIIGILEAYLELTFYWFVTKEFYLSIYNSVVLLISPL